MSLTIAQLLVLADIKVRVILQVLIDIVSKHLLKITFVLGSAGWLRAANFSVLRVLELFGTVASRVLAVLRVGL